MAVPDRRRVRLAQAAIIAITAAIVAVLILVVQPWWSGRVLDSMHWDAAGRSPGLTWTLRKAQGGELLADWGEDWIQVARSGSSSWRTVYWGAEADTSWGDESTLVVTPAYPDDVSYRIDVRSQSQGDAPPGPLLVGLAVAIVAVAGFALAFFVGWRARRRVVQALVGDELERLGREPGQSPFAASEAARLAAEGHWRIVRTEREMREEDKPRRWRLEIQFGSPRDSVVVVESAFAKQTGDGLEIVSGGVFADSPQKTRRLVSQRAVMRSRGSLALGIAIACTAFAFLPMVGAVVAVVGFASLGYAIWAVVTTKRAGRLSRLAITAIPITAVGLLVGLAQLSVAGLLLLPWWFPCS